MEEEGLSRSTKIVIAAILAVAVVIVIALGLWWLQLRRAATARSLALPTPASGAVVAVTVLPTATAEPPVPTPVPPTPAPVNPTPTPSPTPVPPPSSLLGYHAVRYGETLFCIGRAYAVPPQAIALQNGLGYPYWVRIGQRLAIPNVPWRYVPTGLVCARQFDGGTPLPPPTCRVTHMVLLGDTLYSIAGRYQSSVWAIVSANNIANPNLIFPGQVLCIP